MRRRTFLQSSALFAAPAAGAQPRTIDFRYAPRDQQATICFPDDPHKSLVGERGELRYGHVRGMGGTEAFPVRVFFSLRGIEADRVAGQSMDGFAPVITTRVERPQALLTLTAFATRRVDEGRVDNVLYQVEPRGRSRVLAAPVLFLKTRYAAFATGNELRLENKDAAPFLVASCPLRLTDTGDGYAIMAPEAYASSDAPMKLLFRFPLEGRTVKAQADPAGLLAEARAWWKSWSPFQNGVEWKLPASLNNFLLHCARNIMQARERRDGKLTFQVGPTVYRGLWVVDGNFILEAARYLGYDAEVQQGFETTWSQQRADGGIFAGAGDRHWKDTAIAMFTMVRQAELGQDWDYFRRMRAQVLQGVEFIDGLRRQARDETSALGRYGLLARGMGDGGLGGIRDELTNTLWSLVGLKAVAEAAERQNISGFEPARRLYTELRALFGEAARKEMRRHARGFDYLPMLLATDPSWNAPDELNRLQPQTGQWALAQCLYPGLLFSPLDPIVQGYLALMRSCIKEDVPAETGWIIRDGLWNYDAGFAAHAFLWAGAHDEALSIFNGFLNHATPLYCWREEQPLHGALIGAPFGDMPHNWASAECILFLRHMLALEDGPVLRLLEGIGARELASNEEFAVRNTPTRFGRLNLSLAPTGRGWRLSFERGVGPVPQVVRLPARLASKKLSSLKGAAQKLSGDTILVDPASARWEAAWS